MHDQVRRSRCAGRDARDARRQSHVHHAFLTTSVPSRSLRDPIVWHKRLDARVAVGVTLVAGLALAAVLVATGRAITTSSIERSRDDLRAARVAFAHLVETRAQFAAAEARLVVDLPIFRAMLDKDPHVAINGLTIDGITEDYCQKLQATFCVVTDAGGTWTGRGGAVPGAADATAAVSRASSVARTGTPANDVVAAGGDLYLIVAEPARFAEEVVGTFTAAYKLDNTVARELSLITHCDVSFICEREVCGTSFGAATETVLAEMLASDVSALGALDAEPELRAVGGHSYVGGLYALRSAIPGSVRLALLQDWTPTERAVNQLNALVVGIGGLAFVVALLGSLVFSRRLTRPLRDLAAAADRMAGGQWGETVEAGGPIETRTMADAFNRMSSSVAHWHEEADSRARRLGETYERFRSVTDSANDAIISANTQGEILFWNRRAQAVFGYSEESALGRPLTMLLQAQHVEEFTQSLARLAADTTHRGGTIELSGVRNDGTEVPIELSLATWTANGALGFTVVIRDTTERRHAAEALRQRDDELRQAQKMEAVGRLAGGVAHDFNNLLTAILGYADLLCDKLASDDPNRSHIVEIQKAGRSAASLTRGLLAFSRKQVLQPVVLDLNAVVRHSENLLRRLIGEDIELAIALEPSLASVKADPVQVEQMLVNLAVNARDAMPAGGRLTISTVNVDDSTMRLRVPTASGAGVALIVRDTGVGMTDEVRARIFEPFFTTKASGHGTGLGLASVYGTVRQSGGDVWVDSAPGAGSSFTVCLPAVAEAPSQPHVGADDSRPVPAGTETVLLVEDNDAVRRMARETLVGLGYDVVEASNGKDALSIALQEIDRISIVLTDVVMPLMGGAELAKRLRVMRPDLKFIFASGYASDPVPGPPAAVPDAAFLQKPFSPSALGRAVRELLDTSPAA